jgi:long-subunit acyl-CoA synthetase (AMP-forming)
VGGGSRWAPTPVRDVIAIGEAPGATSIFDLLATPSLDDLPAVTPDTIALIPYSSGTTGMPKGVLLSHANLVTVTRQIAARLRPEPTDTLLAIAPFFHILGFTGL